MPDTRAKVQLFVGDYSCSPQNKVHTISSLSDLATSIFQSTRSPRSRSSLTDSESCNQYLVIDALYHLIKITLHAAIVPLFSGQQVDPWIDPQVVRASAGTVVRHGDLYADLLRDYADGQSDITQIPPIVGYGAFVVGTILLSYEISSQETNLYGESELINRISVVKNIIRILESLRAYWRTLHDPVNIPISYARL